MFLNLVDQLLVATGGALLGVVLIFLGERPKDPEAASGTAGVGAAPPQAAFAITQLWNASRRPRDHSIKAKQKLESSGY
jgi:hypothetical protein